MYLGRFQLGQEVPITFRAADATGGPLAPATAPTVEVYSETGKARGGLAMPALERNATTGLFCLRLRLGTGFSAGRYTAVIRHLVAGAVVTEEAVFEVAPGGHRDGAAVALTAFNTPGANFLVFQTDAGKIIRGRNPA